MCRKIKYFIPMKGVLKNGVCSHLSPFLSFTTKERTHNCSWRVHMVDWWCKQQAGSKSGGACQQRRVSSGSRWAVRLQFDFAKLILWPVACGHHRMWLWPINPHPAYLSLIIMIEGSRVFWKLPGDGRRPQEEANFEKNWDLWWPELSWWAQQPKIFEMTISRSPRIWFGRGWVILEGVAVEI